MVNVRDHFIPFKCTRQSEIDLEKIEALKAAVCVTKKRKFNNKS